MNFANLFSVGGAQPIVESAAQQKAIDAAAAIDGVRLDNSELMKFAGWTVADFTEACSHDLPKPDSFRQSPGAGMISGSAGEPTRLRRAVRAWALNQQKLAAEKLRLISKLL